MAKQEFQLGKWEETALYFMKARADGNEMGYMLKADNPAAEAWWKYFIHKGMQKKAIHGCSLARRQRIHGSMSERNRL